MYIEAGAKRVFACSLDWPGLARSGKTEEAALEALSVYAPRYTVVARRASVPPKGLERAVWAIVARLPTRSGGADFGAITAALPSDEGHLTAAEANRSARLVSASWELLDEVVASSPEDLRKGPRGGGRDRDAIAGHVAAAEQIYAKGSGLALPVPKPGGPETVRANRAALLEWCRSGRALPSARAGWPPRFTIRRVLWHVLDHMWEIEDRRPAGPG